MNPLDIIIEFYKPGSLAYEILVRHSELVAKKAIDTAKSVTFLQPDLNFIEEAAMLHDIGIFKVYAPDIGCFGEYSYLCHGYLGRDILEKKNLPRHGLVCERHVGTGITVEEIKRHNLPLPERDMVPVSIEEQIICFADKFFSKNPDSMGKEKSVDDIINGLSRHGQDKAVKFESWLNLFGRE
jgi:uncharacterized protein